MSPPAVFTDLDKALNHLVNHVGAMQVRRGEKTLKLYDFAPERVLLALLTEKGVTAEAAAFFAPYALGAQSPIATRGLLYTLGSPRARAPMRPGDIFWFRGGGQTAWGVALKVDAAGQPTEYVSVDRQQYQATIALRSGAVGLDAILLVNAPSTQRRDPPAPDQGGAFYAGGDTLHQLIAGVLQPRITKVQDGQNEISLSTGEAKDLPRLLALGAPDWIRSRLLPADSISATAAAVDTLGGGLVAYDGKAPLSLGTWLFLRNGGFGVLVGQTPEGLPATLLGAGGSGHDVTAIEPGDVQRFWIPSTAPYRYTAQPPTAGYADLDKLIGKIRLWGAVRDYDTPLLRQGYFQDPACLTPGFLEICQKGPASAADWAYYLNDLGGGLLPSFTPLVPGDIVLFRMGEMVNQAIYLGDDQMAYVDKRKTQNFGISRPDQVLAIWRPAPGKRAG